MKHDAGRGNQTIGAGTFDQVAAQREDVLASTFLTHAGRHVFDRRLYFLGTLGCPLVEDDEIRHNAARAQVLLRKVSFLGNRHVVFH